MSKIYYRWESRFPHCSGPELRRLVKSAGKLAPLPDGDWSVSLRFVDDAAMARANADYVGHTGSTDVITFSYLDDLSSCFPGEVALELLICPDAARREGAKRTNSNYSREMALYVVHGILHASGEDDLTPEARRNMRRAEKRVMDELAKSFDFTVLFPAPERLTAEA